MIELPFDIPKSLASYVEQFDREPLKATKRLKEQLKKRGPDAVGHFLLAWFYHLKDKNEEAVKHALKARIYAPGSPFFGKLHYYLAHPYTFDAWKPTSEASPQKHSSEKQQQPGPVLDLDALIEKLSDIESTRIKAKPELAPSAEPAASDGDSDVDNIASETLATIHERQGKTEAAIQMYKRLKKLNKEKEGYYGEQISRLENMQNQKDDE